jgi:hypothetical protein
MNQVIYEPPVGENTEISWSLKRLLYLFRVYNKIEAYLLPAYSRDSFDSRNFKSITILKEL